MKFFRNWFRKKRLDITPLADLAPAPKGEDFHAETVVLWPGPKKKEDPAPPPPGPIEYKVGSDADGDEQALWAETPMGGRHLRASQVFIRASDGRVFISPTLLGSLDDVQAAMVRQLDLVDKVGVVIVGGE